MPNVKVHNLNKYDYSEKFKGSMINIPAGGHIIMEYFEAEQFLSRANAVRFLKNGRQDPKTYKMLKIDEDDKKEAYDQMHGTKNEDSEKTYVCHACSKEFLTKTGLLKHIKSKHKDLMVDSEARDELIDDEDI